MKRTSKNSELVAVRNQFLYGHLPNQIPIADWLLKHYAPGSPLQFRINQFKPYLENLPSRSRVLELGAGAGDFSFCLLTEISQELDLILSDIDLEYLNRFSLPTQRFFAYPNPVQRMEFSADSIPFESNSISLILIKSAVHHFEEPRLAFREIHRCLIPGGRVVFINDPQITNLWAYLNRYKFGALDKELGHNCKSWTHSEYMNMGKDFLSKRYFLDPLLSDAIANTRPNWAAPKRFLASVMLKQPIAARALNRRMNFPISYMFVK